jgi:RsiW-degrading membrane proteinase PrsW (M82 family)
MEATILALAVAAPFLLWPAEIILPYPHFLEEILKLALVWLILQKTGPALKKIRLGLIVAVFFTLSESFLYFLIIFQIDQPTLFLRRLLLTLPLHALSLLLMLFPGLKKKELALIGFLFAVCLHYGYNLFIGEVF